mgnify:CR=1 FL=1
MKYIKYIALAGLVGLTSSCIDDLLNRPATTEVSSDLFWTSTDDALSSTYGVYNAVRTLFATDYYYDGHGEFLAVRVSVIFLHGDPERRAADFPVCGTMHTGLSTVPTTPFSM